MNKRLTVYGKGLRILVNGKNEYFVEYDENRNKQITNKIQIAYLKKYFDRNGVNPFFKKCALEYLNEYSKHYNKTLKEKDVMTFDKMYEILKRTKNGYHGFGTLKDGRKVVSEYYVLDKPMTKELQDKINRVYKNCTVVVKSVYKYAPEIKSSVVYIKK